MNGFNMKKIHRALVLTGLFITTLILCACGGGKNNSPPENQPPNNNPEPVIRTIDLGDDRIVDEGSDDGRTDITFTLTLDGPADGDISVDYSVVDISTEAPDFIDSEGSLTIADGETVAQISVGILADTAFEINEHFSLTLSNPSANAVLGKSSATGLIVNDDELIVYMDLWYLGDFNASLSFPKAEIDYDLQIDVDEFLAGLDLTELALPYDIYYTDDIHLPWLAASGTLTIELGGSSSGRLFLDLAIPLSGFAIDGNFLVSFDWSDVLENLPAVELEIIVPIEEDDIAEETPLLGLSGPNSVVEGDDGDATELVYSVTLSEAFSSDVEVHYETVASTASSPNDYIAASGSLTLLAGETEVSFSVSVNGDEIEEENEVFYVALASNSGEFVLQTPWNIVTIFDDDSVNETRSLAIHNAELLEGDSGTANMQFEVTLDAPATSGITFQFKTADDTAIAGVDYQATEGERTFQIGESSLIISVPIFGDTDAEDDETFSLETTAILGDAQAVLSGVGKIITDDPIARVNIADFSMIEGDTDVTTFGFAVTLSEALSTALDITYTSNDISALAGEDYTSVNGTLTIPAGETQGFIIVDVNGDTDNESDENFQVVISINSNAAELEDDTATGTILNDDSAGGWAGAELVHLASPNAFPGKAYSPRLAFRANGDKHVIYMQSNSIWHRISQERGFWLDPLQVGSIASMTHAPALAVDPNGNGLAVWPDDTLKSASIYAADEWQSESLPQEVEVYNDIRMASNVATGEATVVWAETGNSSNGFLTNIWAANYVHGAGWQDMALVENLDDYAFTPEIAVAGSNALTVFPVTPATSGYTNIHAYWKSGSAWVGPITLNSVTTYHASSPKVDINETGDAAVVWHQEEPVPSGIARRSIYINRYDSTSSSWSGAELVESTQTHTAEFPDVAIDGKGNVFVIWLQQSKDLSTKNLWGRRYDYDDETWADAELLEFDDTAPTSPIISHQVVADNVGNAIVVYVQNDGTLENLRSARFNLETNSWITSELIEEIDTGNANLPHLVMNRETGDAMVVWQQADGSNINIWANRYTR